MTALPHLDDIHPPEPELEALRARTEAWVEEIAAAPDAEAVVAAIRQWDRVRRNTGTWGAWVHVRFAQDSTDAEAVARKERLDALGPALYGLEVRVMAAVLDSPHRAGVALALGDHLLQLWEADRRGHDEAIEADQVREAQAVSRYMALTGAARIRFRGEEHGIPAMRAFMEDTDRQTRHDAARALWAWYGSQAAEITGTFDQLMDLRQDMSRTLGDRDFATTAYRGLHRFDYGPDQVALFREELHGKVVPLVQELRAAQARRLGVDRLMAWDLALTDPQGNPRPQGDPAWQEAQAATLMARLDPELGDFYAMMRARGLLDLVPRPGKQPGGFCTLLADAQAPFIFANMNGTSDDARVFTHELGHAWQAWNSKDAAVSDLVWPSYDAAEVHSMSLELLSWPHMDLLFGPDAARYRREHLANALIALPWLCAIDDFQHRIYADPAADRDRTWRAVEAHWLPELDWGDIETGARGKRWMSVGHLFFQPFYAIDYALAQTCALQLWLLARKDPAAAMTRYRALCRRGGAAPFVALVEGAGLRSPFTPGLLSEVVDEARRVLAELDA